MSALCPLCDAAGITFDERERVPVLLNRTYPSAEEARAAATGALAMTACRQCGFVWNARFDPDLIAYTPDYENDQSHSDAFRAHLESVADAAIAVAPEGPIDIVEIGAGQGRFLALLAHRSAGRLRSASGFDPAWRGSAGDGPQGVRLYKDYFGAATMGLLPNPASLAVSRHTIEHVPNPIAFLSAIRGGLGAGSRARLVIETPCADWIIAERAVQDFFYEHCSLFSPGALLLALARGGFEAARVSHVFGGQYLLADALAGAATRPRPAAPTADFAAYGRSREAFVRHWQGILAADRRPAYLWGAGAKGVTFSLLMGDAGARLAGLIDINPAKQGRFAPVSGLPIVAPEAIAGRDALLIVMNPNYAAEIAGICRRLASPAEILVL